MKSRLATKFVISGLMILIITVLSGTYYSSSIVRQANFDFTFGYGSCGTNTLDTFKNTFSKDMHTTPPSFVTIRLMLLAREKDRIFSTMAAIDLFRYPSSFTVAVRPGEAVTRITPATTYRLLVRNGTVMKTLRWRDDMMEPTNQQARRLRGLMVSIQDIIVSHSEVKKLPQPRALCV